MLNSKQSAIANLRDIHMPEAIPAWPPAIGWFILAFCVLAIIFTITYFIYVTWQRRAVKRAAFRRLNHLQKSQHAYTGQQLASSISILLRRISIAYFKQSDVAALYGDKWFQFISQFCKKEEDKQQLKAIIDAPYQQDITVDKAALLDATARWIKQLPLTQYSERRCLN